LELKAQYETYLGITGIIICLYRATAVDSFIAAERAVCEIGVTLAANGAADGPGRVAMEAAIEEIYVSTIGAKINSSTGIFHRSKIHISGKQVWIDEWWKKRWINGIVCIVCEGSIDCLVGLEKTIFEVNIAVGFNINSPAKIVNEVAVLKGDGADGLRIHSAAFFGNGLYRYGHTGIVGAAGWFDIAVPVYYFSG
ncbi:unnamed protein product, partial [marine sediment metagenome]